MNEKELKRMRSGGLIDQIEWYLYRVDDGFKLSADQKKHLAELRDTICVFGELGELYAEECDEVLRAA